MLLVDDYSAIRICHKTFKDVKKRCEFLVYRFAKEIKIDKEIVVLKVRQIHKHL